MGPRKPFDSIYVFRIVAETSPEYLEASITNVPELALVILTGVLVTVSQNLMAYNL
jgi:hypothetical protein